MAQAEDAVLLITEQEVYACRSRKETGLFGSHGARDALSDIDATMLNLKTRFCHICLKTKPSKRSRPEIARIGRCDRKTRLAPGYPLVCVGSLKLAVNPRV